MPQRPLTDYVRAFAVSLRLTLHGEKAPGMIAQEAAEPVLRWCRDTVAAVGIVETALSAAIIKPTDVTLRLDGRAVSLETALAAVRYHAAQEYPHLLRANNTFTPLAIQASVMNDRYAVTRFAGHEGLSVPVREALEALSTQLAAMPARGQ